MTQHFTHSAPGDLHVHPQEENKILVQVREVASGFTQYGAILPELPRKLYSSDLPVSGSVSTVPLLAPHEMPDRFKRYIEALQRMDRGRVHTIRSEGDMKLN